MRAFRKLPPSRAELHIWGGFAPYHGDDRWLSIAEEEPLILRMPLVRQDNRLTVGLAEGDWKEWVGR